MLLGSGLEIAELPNFFNPNFSFLVSPTEHILYSELLSVLNSTENLERVPVISCKLN